MHLCRVGCFGWRTDERGFLKKCCQGTTALGVILPLLPLGPGGFVSHQSIAPDSAGNLARSATMTSEKSSLRDRFSNGILHNHVIIHNRSTFPRVPMFNPIPHLVAPLGFSLKKSLLDARILLSSSGGLRKKKSAFRPAVFLISPKRYLTTSNS